MPNPNPRIDHLESSRGRKRKLNQETVSMRISTETKHELESLAKSFGCFYGGKPWIAGLLSRIAKHELLIVPPNYVKTSPYYNEDKEPSSNIEKYS